MFMFMGVFVCACVFVCLYICVCLCSCIFVCECVSNAVMVNKLDEQIFTRESESHWVPYSYGLVPHLSLVNYLL